VPNGLLSTGALATQANVKHSCHVLARLINAIPQRVSSGQALFFSA
jgi:hypothetical protein